MNQSIEQKAKELESILPLFIKIARHARNIPHPQLPVEVLRREGVEAEVNAENILGRERYEKLCEKAFKEILP